MRAGLLASLALALAAPAFTWAQPPAGPRSYTPVVYAGVLGDSTPVSLTVSGNSATLTIRGCSPVTLGLDTSTTPINLVGYGQTPNSPLAVKGRLDDVRVALYVTTGSGTTAQTELLVLTYVP